MLIISVFLFSLISLYSQSDGLFSREKLRNIALHISSDNFYGRGTGQIGGDLAADFLEKKFSSIGLKPIGDDGSFKQNIPFHEISTLVQTEMNLLYSNNKHQFIYSKDFLVYKSGELTFFPKPMEMLFVGFGIIAPEFDHNDYLSLDVTDKVLVMFSGEPNSQDPEYFSGEFNTHYSDIEYKQKNAMARGAKACIIIPNPEELKNYGYEYLKNEYSGSQLSLAYYPSAILTLIINPEKAKFLFEGSKYSYQDILNRFYRNNLINFSLENKFTFKGNFKDRNFIAPNIVGMIEGSDRKLKDSYLIVSAHYDHLGIGLPIKNDSIYNGFLDNAIGVSALINIAEQLANSKIKPKRSIIFILTTAEEKGLLGSIFYCNNPIFPLYKTIANINIDGLATIDKFNSIIGIGAGLSSLSEILINSAAEMNLYVEEIPTEAEANSTFNRSDQIAFAKAGIPAVLIAEGTDYKNIDKLEGLDKLYDYFTNIYHTPFDDENQIINFDAVIQHTEFIFHFIQEIANTAEEPVWKNDSPFLLERLKTRAEKR